MKFFAFLFLACVSLVGHAADYTVRENASSDSYARLIGGPDIRPILAAGNSVAAGCHVRFSAWQPLGQVMPMLSVSDGTTGTQRYMRAHINHTTKNLWFQGRELGEAAPTTYSLDSGQAVVLDTWYGIVWTIEPVPTDQWRITIYIQEHGGTLYSATKTVDAMEYTDANETRDIYGMFQHSYYQSGVTEAHQMYGDVAGYFFAQNATVSAIELYLARTDPADLFAGQFIVFPELADWSETVGIGGPWVTGGTAPTTNGTLEFFPNVVSYPSKVRGLFMFP